MKNMAFPILTSFKLLLIICVCSFASDLHSQFSLGVRTGFCNSWRAHRNFIDKDKYIHRRGFDLSFLTYIGISKTLRIGVEPGITERVTSATFFQFESPSFENKIFLNYFELPLFISARYPLWHDRLKMNVKAGYGISSVAEAKREIPTGLQGEPLSIESFPINKLSSMNTLDHGIYSGIGLEYKIGKQKLILESVYYMGMNDVIVFESTKNRSMHFGVGYMIDF